MEEGGGSDAYRGGIRGRLGRTFWVVVVGVMVGGVGGVGVGDGEVMFFKCTDHVGCVGWLWQRWWF